MRGYVLRALLVKEARRHFADRGGLTLAVLLVAVALLVATGGGQDARQRSRFVLGTTSAIVDYWEAGSLISHLQAHPLAGVRTRFRGPRGGAGGPEPRGDPALRNTPPTDQGGSSGSPRRGEPRYSEGTIGLQLRRLGEPGPGPERYSVVFLYHGADAGAVAGLSRWFYARTFEHFAGRPILLRTDEPAVSFPSGTSVIRVEPADAEAGGTSTASAGAPSVGALGAPTGVGRHALLFHSSALAGGEVPAPEVVLEEERRSLRSKLDDESLLIQLLMMFSLFLFCVYLLPSFTCEERERGVLLAQMLSPATTPEILAAKFLFYPMAGGAIAVLVAAITRPAVLALPFFWLTLLVASACYLAVGMMISSLAATQRKASVGALAYLLVSTTLLVVTNQLGIPIMQFLAFEPLTSRSLSSALAGVVGSRDWLRLGWTSLLATFWVGLAVYLFRRRGWQ